MLSFFPIDGAGWGDEGLAHNYHFTYELHTTFTYAMGQTFTFTGDDDLWVFINGKLAIFFAERHTTESNFRIDTSILLTPVPVPEAGSSLLCLMLAGAALRAWKRR